MANVWINSLGSVFLISLISLLGVASLSVRKRTLMRILRYTLAFSAGALFGTAFIHLIPESVSAGGYTSRLSLYILSGLLVSFLVQKFIHWGHDHLSTLPEHIQPYAWMNIFGEVFHNYIDGLIIGASYLASFELGVASTLAVGFHEIPQELGDFGVLVHGGFSRKKALAMNFLVALTAVLGTVTALLASGWVSGINSFLLPFSAGTFIYIAGSTLIPELQKEVETGQAVLEFISLLIGMGAMWALTLI